MADSDNLKQRIHAGEPILGVSVPCDPDRGRLEDILGKDSYDFVSTDSQHSAYNEDRLVAFCNLAKELGVPVQFRIKHTRHTYLVGNHLDLGPTGIEVPQVEEEATVDEAIDYFYYPQIGRRSWGGMPRRGIGERPDRLEYAEWWNGYGVLWMQIESIQAVTQARRLAKSGVDCFSTGPADMSFDIEAHPGHPFQSVDDCIRHLVKDLEDSDVRVCHRSYDPALRNKYRDMGVTVLLEQPKK